MSDELRRPPATIEIPNGRHDRVAFGLGAGESHGIRKLVFWNIDCGLHASILSFIRIPIKVKWNPTAAGVDRHFVLLALVLGLRGGSQTAGLL